MLRITDGEDAPPVPPPTLPLTDVPLAADESAQGSTTPPPTDLPAESSITPPPYTSMQPPAEASASSEVDDQDVSDPLPNLNTAATSPVRYNNESAPAVRVRTIGTRLTPTTRYCLDRLITDYNTTILDPNETGEMREYIHWIMSRADDKTARPIFTIFGWFDRSTTYHYSDVRADIRGASLPLMSVLYIIGRDYLGATVAPLTRPSGFEARTFMTFDPIDTVYHAPGHEGSYISTTTDIERYPATLKRLMQLDMSKPFRQMYILAILLDFMAFTAQTMRAVIEDRVASHRHLRGIRELMSDTVHQLYVNDYDATPYKELFDCFNAIILEINPIPYISPYGTPPDSPDERPHKFHTPRTHHRLNSPLPKSPRVTYDDIPAGVFRRYSTANAFPAFFPDESAAAITFRPSSSSSSSSSTTANAPRAAARASPIACTPDDYADYSILPTPSTYQPPNPPKRKRDDSDDHSAKLIILEHHLKSLATTSKIVFDSGCSITGTSNIHDLHDVTPCGTLSVQGAFGPAAQPAHRGKLGPLNLDAIVLEGMGNQTLVSLSSYCAGGDTGTQHVGIFTATDFRMYELRTVLPALSTITEIGTETTRGTVQGGIYIQDS